MAHFIVSYDLHNQRNYKPMWELLESWGATRLLESLWVVTLNNTTAEVRDALNQKIDNDDAIAVIELKSGSMWATMRARKAGVDWMKANIS
jgi:CRISPR-associated endonuclease Cas2